MVAYADHEGKPRIRSFEKKREADAYHASVSRSYAPASTSLIAKASRW